MRTVTSEYFLVVSPGSYRLQRRWVRGSVSSMGERMSGGSNRGTPGVGRTDRPVTEFSAKARRQMRQVWNALPWDEVPNLAMVTLTYPGDWRPWCPDGRKLKDQLRAFRERWRRKWGGAVGTWTLEFQPRPSRPEHERLAPHFHLYVGIPDGAVIEADATDGRLVWDWARKAWWEIVGSGNPAHRYWGVHVRPCFYGRFGGGRQNGKKVGDYLWRESGKLAQKEAPEGFEGVKWWDVWGMKPREVEAQISEAAFVEMRRPTVTLRDKVTGAKVRRPSGMDGLSVTNVDGMETGIRMLRWAEGEAEAKGRTRAAGGAGDADAGSVEDGSGSLLDAGVEGVEVGALGGGGVGVVEHLLNVEQVEAVSTVVGEGVVEDAGGGASEVVRGHVAEVGCVGAAEDDASDAACLGDAVAPGEGATAATGLLSAEDGVGGSERSAEGEGVATQVLVQEGAEARAGADLAGSAGLADPGDDRGC